mgnify:CR=1 FL=1|tara:strand:+ start:1433 stop:1738 length:306 start_codon:yes stop_codon:yes gene_type:complete
MSSITQPLEEAIRILRERAEAHGDHVELHKRIAKLWSVYLGIWVEPHQVAVLLALMKLARSEFDPSNKDNWHDFLGYGGIWADLLKIGSHRARKRGVKEDL